MAAVFGVSQNLMALVAASACNLLRKLTPYAVVRAPGYVAKQNYRAIVHVGLVVAMTVT